MAKNGEFIKSVLVDQNGNSKTYYLNLRQITEIIVGEREFTLDGSYFPIKGNEDFLSEIDFHSFTTQRDLWRQMPDRAWRHAAVSPELQELAEMLKVPYVDLLHDAIQEKIEKLKNNS